MSLCRTMSIPLEHHEYYNKLTAQVPQADKNNYELEPDEAEAEILEHTELLNKEMISIPNQQAPKRTGKATKTSAVKQTQGKLQQSEKLKDKKQLGKKENIVIGKKARPKKAVENNMKKNNRQKIKSKSLAKNL